MPTAIAKQRLLRQLVGLPRQAIARKENAFCALIVDDDTLKVLSGAAKYYDLLDSGISVIQSITKVREPLPNLDCIYFLTPKREVVEKLLQDFKSEKKPHYRSAYIFWSTTVAQVPEVLEMIAGCNPLISRLKSFVDFNMSFVCYESRVFHVDMPYAIRQLFGNKRQFGFARTDDVLRTIAARLATMCITLGDFSRIRFAGNSAYAAVNRSLAQYVQEYFDLVKPRSAITTGHTELIILDRSIDPCVLLLHEYTYQALAYDVLDIPVCAPWHTASPEDTYSFVNEKKEKKTLLLSEDDELYTKYRHKHIASVITQVNEELLKFSQDNAAAQYNKKGEADMAAAIRELPQYAEMLGKFLSHINMSEACFSRLQAAGIFRAGIMEQDMATGVDKFGKSLQVIKVLEELAKLVSDKSGISAEEKMRLLLLYFTMMDGVQEEDRNKMVRAAGMSVEVERAIEAFIGLQLQIASAVTSDPQHTSLKHMHRIHKDEEKLTFYKRKAKSAQYELSRFEPIVKTIMESAAASHLSRSAYPYLSDPDMKGVAEQQGDSTLTGRIRATQFEWDWTGADEVTNKKGEEMNDILLDSGSGKRKTIIFIVGGISFSEIRSAYEVTRGSDREIYIGGTNITTPSMLFELLKLD